MAPMPFIGQRKRKNILRSIQAFHRHAGKNLHGIQQRKRAGAGLKSRGIYLIPVPVQEQHPVAHMPQTLPQVDKMAEHMVEQEKAFISTGSTAVSTTLPPNPSAIRKSLRLIHHLPLPNAYRLSKRRRQNTKYGCAAQWSPRARGNYNEYVRRLCVVPLINSPLKRFL